MSDTIDNKNSPSPHPKKKTNHGQELAAKFDLGSKFGMEQIPYSLEMYTIYNLRLAPLQ
jgi:hypothetical protein